MLPTYHGRIFAKIVRLDAASSARRKIRLQRKKDCFWGGDGATAAILSDQQARKTKLESKAQAKSSGTVPSSPKKVATFAPVGDLLGDSDDYGGSVPPSTGNSSSSVLDFTDQLNSGSVNSSSNVADGVVDIDEGAAPVPTVVLNREELAARREAGVQEKVKEALEFKQELDENQRREAEELEDAKAKHDKALTAWAIKNNEKANIRNLLTSMHTVLWPDSGWKTVHLGDVIDSKKVKFYYRKAMLVVHPDRCSDKSAEIRFIAKRIFEGVNEAWQEFLKKEGLA